MAISTDEALSSYGYVYAIAQSVPELNNYLQQAIQGGWSADKLTAQIESSQWWMQNADTVRNLAIQHAAEPGTYAQTIANAKQRIQLKAYQLGRSITDDSQLTNLAINTLTTNNGWDDNVLSNTLASQTKLATGVNDSYGGQAAQLRDHMTQVAQSYGVPYSDSFLNEWTTSVEAGWQSLDGFENLMRARAKASFPNLANQIDAGMTVKDIADPYVSTYAQTLEVPTTQVTLQDPAIQKALQNVDPKTGTVSTKPLWQFQQDLKKDPRYDQTTQAKTDAYTTLSTIAKDFGFDGASVAPGGSK